MLVRWAARRVKEEVIGSLVVDGYPHSGMLSEIADQTSRHTSETLSLADQDCAMSRRPPGGYVARRQRHPWTFHTTRTNIRASRDSVRD